jgi:hypothetical protein
MPPFHVLPHGFQAVRILALSTIAGTVTGKGFRVTTVFVGTCKPEYFALGDVFYVLMGVPTAMSTGVDNILRFHIQLIL